MYEQFTDPRASIPSNALPLTNGYKVARSIGTICFFVFFAPLIGSVLWQGVLSGNGLLSSFQMFIFAPIFVAGQISLIYVIGFLPALMTGCLAALVSPSIRQGSSYIAAVVAIGTSATAVLCLGFNLAYWQAGGFRLVICALATSSVCAPLSALFRFKTLQLPKENLVRKS
jgi:hypothetical protein